MTENIKKILIVCDSVTDFTHYSKVLSSGLYSFLHVKNFQQLVNQQQSLNPDLIIINFPCQAFNSHDDLKYFSDQAVFSPFVVISELETAAPAVACMKAGAYDYIIKNEIFRLPEVTAAALQSGILRNSEEMFRSMFTEHSSIMLLVDPETGIIEEANKSAQAFYGYTFYGTEKILIGTINSKSTAEIHQEMNKAATRQLNNFIFNHKLASGEFRTVEVKSTPIQLNGKKLLFSVIHDISESANTEEMLRRSEAENKAIISTVPDLLFRINREGKYIESYTSSTASLYVPREMFIGRTIAEVLPPALAEMSMDALHKAFLSNQIISYEYELPVNGEDYYFENRVVAINNNEALSIIRDITDRNKTQLSLNWNESFLRLMTSSSPLAFFVVDNRTDEILYFNHQFCAIWGITHLEEQMSRKLLKNNDIIPACLGVLKDVSAFAESCKPLQYEDNRITIEDQIPYSDGRTIRRFSTQIRGENDEYYGRFYIFEDITERKKAEFHLSLQRDLGIGLSAASTIQDTLDLSLALMLKTEIVDRGGIYLLNNKTNNLELSVHRNVSDDFVKSTSIYTQETAEVKLVMEGQPVYKVYNDLLGPDKKPVSNDQISQIAVIPIQNEGKVFGSLNLGTACTEVFSLKDRFTLEAFANQIGIAIARIHAEDALKTSQLNFQLMFDTLDDFMFILNMEGKILKTNPVVQKRLGFSEEELYTMHVLEVHPPERRVEAGNIVNEMLTGKALFCPVPLITKDGVHIPVETRVVMGRWDNEDALYGISRDITERRKAEKELQLRESFLSAVINNHPGMFWLKDIAGKFIMVNDKNNIFLHENNSKAQQSVIGKTDFDFLSKEVSEKHREEDNRVMESRQPIIKEEYISSEKNDFWYEIFKFPVVDKKGVVIGVSGYAIDITERKVSETRLRMLNSAFDSFTLAMAITDIEGHIKWVNPAFALLTGYKTDEVIGQFPSILKSGKQDDDFYQVFWQTILSGKVWSGELINKRKDGSLYYEEETITPVFNEKGEISNFITIKIDISHRREIEEALRLSEQRWQFALEGSGDGIWDWDVVTNKVFYSKQWKAMLGFNNDEIGDSRDEWSKRIHPDDRERSFIDLENHFSGESDIYVSEHRMLCKDGTYKWILDRGKTIEWIEKGVPLRVIGTHTDITQRKMLEETLKKGIEKERELNDLKSRFVSIASHEFRTPLASILIISESLIAYWKKMEEIQIVERLDKIKDQILHLSNIVNDVLQISKIQEGKTEINPEYIDIVSLCKQVILSFNSTHQSKNTIRFEYSPDEQILLLDERMMQQVMSNLISNAIKYTPENPVITVSIEKTASETIISVSDNGIGIPVEEQKHLFTPFFRASNTRLIQGNGLGLNIVRESVRLQGGEVTFESTPGKGSTFLIHIFNNSIHI